MKVHKSNCFQSLFSLIHNYLLKDRKFFSACTALQTDGKDFMSQ